MQKVDSHQAQYLLCLFKVLFFVVDDAFKAFFKMADNVSSHFIIF